MTADPPPDPPPPPKDGLDPFRELIRNPAALAYLAVAGGALLVLVLIVFQLYFSAIGAALVFALGLLGLLLRWTAMPVFLVAVIGYVSLAPLGVPMMSAGSPSMIPGSQFMLRDLFLLATLLTYLLAQFRLLSVIHAAVPFEATSRYLRKRAKAAVRPPLPVSDGELGRLFVRVAVFVVVGQLLWLGLTRLVLDFRSEPWIAVVQDDTTVTYRRGTVESMEAGETDQMGQALWHRSRSVSRCVLAVGLFVGLGIAVRFAFWFWRVATLNREQAKLYLTDAQWAEARREIDRQEKWRAWMVDKLNGTTKPRSGCGTLFLVIGMPAILLLVFWLLMMAMGCVKS